MKALLQSTLYNKNPSTGVMWAEPLNESFVEIDPNLFEYKAACEYALNKIRILSTENVHKIIPELALKRISKEAGEFPFISYRLLEIDEEGEVADDLWEEFYLP